MAIWKVAAGLLLFCTITAPARADSWLPPETTAYVSRDGAWRLTVHPRGISSPLAYFEDKVAKLPNAGRVSGSAQTSALGHMQRRENGQWRTVWEAPLANEVSPVEALVRSGGQAVTFDNWHSMGYGNDVVAIYGIDGELVRSLALSDFLPKEYVRALPRTASSMQWRGDPRLSRDSRQLIIPVVIPSVGQEERSDEERIAYVDVRFDMATGERVSDTGPGWANALASARKAHQNSLKQAAAAKARFISPLRAPKQGALRDWHGYLMDAFVRLDTNREDGYPATKVIPSRLDAGFARIVGSLREELADWSAADGVLMIASPSQETLVSVLTKELARVKAGALVNARVYVAVDDRNVGAVRSALAHTGAKLIQIDPARPIPQRKERVDRYLRDQQESD